MKQEGFNPLLEFYWKEQNSLQITETWSQETKKERKKIK